MMPSPLRALRRTGVLLACAAIAASALAQTSPPVAPVRDVTDTYFGVSVPDPYRYMEDLKNAEVAAWNMLRVRDHPKSQWKTQLGVLEAAEALNKSTLRLKLKTPSPGFLRSMAYASGARVYMNSKTAMDKLGEEFRGIMGCDYFSTCRRFMTRNCGQHSWKISDRSQALIRAI